MTTMTYSGALVVTTCWCGLRQAIPSELMRQAEHNGKAIYCPLGHTWVVVETEAERLRRQLAAEEGKVADYRRWLAEERARAERAERRRAAAKGQLTRTKNRIAKGVCPCCNRSFVDLARHMETKHPDYAGSTAE